MWFVLFVVHQVLSQRAEGLTTNNTKDTNMGAPGFLSCGWCFSWFNDSKVVKSLVFWGVKSGVMGV